MRDRLALRSTSPAATHALGACLARLLPAGSLLALRGELGAGKTVLTKGFAAGLGLDPDTVRSPTFALHASHDSPRGPLEHLDTYRLEGAEALCDLGFLDLLDGSRYVVVEWADRVTELVPDDALWIELTHEDEERRRIELRAAPALLAATRAAIAGIEGLAAAPRVAVVGAGGRLGALIVAGLRGAPDLCLGAEVGRGAGPGRVDRIPEGCDVAIDVSAAARLPQTLREAEAAGCALIVASTGHDEAGREAMEAAAARLPLLFAPNLSLGVALLRRLVRTVATVLPDADTEIVEAHHRAKRDAPSGTARLLYEAVRDARGGGALQAGRGPESAPRADGEIGVHALRLGDVVGEHCVSFAWDAQRLELSHRASSREVFARGALAAARFLAGKAAGYYTVDDLIDAQLARRAPAAEDATQAASEGG